MIDTGMLTVGLLGIGLFQAATPSLHELRQAHPNDLSKKQAILDATIPASGIAVVIAVITTIKDKGNPTTALLMLTLTGFYMYWYYSVSCSPSQPTIEGW